MTECETGLYTRLTTYTSSTTRARGGGTGTVHLTTAQSLLKAESGRPLLPRPVPQTVDQLKVSWVSVSWRWVRVVCGESVELGTWQPGVVANTVMASLDST